MNTRTADADVDALLAILSAAEHGWDATSRQQRSDHMITGALTLRLIDAHYVTGGDEDGHFRAAYWMVRITDFGRDLLRKLRDAERVPDVQRERDEAQKKLQLMIAMEGTRGACGICPCLNTCEDECVVPLSADDRDSLDCRERLREWVDGEVKRLDHAYPGWHDGTLLSRTGGTPPAEDGAQ
jgi:hypothetical protein